MLGFSGSEQGLLTKFREKVSVQFHTIYKEPGFLAGVKHLPGLTHTYAFPNNKGQGVN